MGPLSFFFGMGRMLQWLSFHVSSKLSYLILPVNWMRLMRIHHEENREGDLVSIASASMHLWDS